MQIFVVEDDINIQEMVIYALVSSGFSAKGFSDGISLFSELNKDIPALILLDIMLPGEDGISILNKLKKTSAFKSIPVIMLTAKGSELDRIKGLDLGADDYITKPFSILEAISRIRAVIRRCYPSEVEDQNELKLGEILLNKNKRTVLVSGQEISLTYKEFELLYYMMINQEIVLSREKILTEIWGFDYTGETRTVDMHIKSIRQKLGNSSSIIKTVRNVGYKIGG